MKPPPEVISGYDPPRCPHYVWTEEALTQLENLMYIDTLHDTHRVETINDYDNNKNVSTEFGLVLENIAEYNKHCNAIDAYLDTNRK